MVAEVPSSAEEHSRRKSFKRSKKGARTVPQGFFFNWVRIEDTPQTSSASEPWDLPVKHSLQGLQRHVAPLSRSLQEKGSRGISSELELHDRSPCAPRFDRGSDESPYLKK